MQSLFSPASFFVTTILYALLVLGVFSTAGIAEAQFSLTESVTINITPNFPKENDTVTAKVESASTDLNRATISWYVNGKRLIEGLGETSATFQVGASGKATSVAIIIFADTGEKIEKDLSIIPSEVDLVYESKAYTQPFYRGRTLLPVSAPVTITAIPHLKTSSGATISSKNLIYKWSDGTKVLGSLSGAGKNSVTIDGPEVYRTKNISVEVSSLDSTRQAQGSVVITPRDQKVLLYEASPLQGVLFDRPLLQAFQLAEDELTLLAVPFFFSANTRAGSGVRFTWRINDGKAEPSPDDQGLITLRPDGEGVAKISVALKGIAAYLEQAETETTLQF